MADHEQQQHEHALIERLREGDPEAFAKLMTLYAPPLLRFAYYTVGSHDVAEDVVQQVFVRLWEKRTTLGPEQLKPYLFRAVRNRALNEQSAKSVRDRYKIDIQENARTGTLPAIVPSPEDEILIGTTVQVALDQLSERRRLALQLRIREGLTHAEIAEALDISPVAAQSLVARAIVDLKKIIWGA